MHPTLLTMNPKTTAVNTGWLSIRDALASSINVVALKVLIDVGFEPTIQLAHQMGIKSQLKPTYSLALAPPEVNLLELTSLWNPNL